MIPIIAFDWLLKGVCNVPLVIFMYIYKFVYVYVISFCHTLRLMVLAVNDSRLSVHLRHLLASFSRMRGLVYLPQHNTLLDFLYPNAKGADAGEISREPQNK